MQNKSPNRDWYGVLFIWLIAFLAGLGLILFVNATINEAVLQHRQEVIQGY